METALLLLQKRLGFSPKNRRLSVHGKAKSEDNFWACKRKKNMKQDKTQPGTKIKMAVFWVVAPYSLVEVHRRFRGSCFLHYQGDSPARIRFVIDLIINSDIS
jgi:hypothetical protein